MALRIVTYITISLICAIATQIDASHHMSMKFLIKDTSVKCHVRNDKQIDVIKDAVQSYQRDFRILTLDDYDDSCIIPLCSIFSRTNKIELNSEVEVTYETVKNAIILIDGGFRISKAEEMSQKKYRPYMWTFGILHYNVNYFKSIVNLCNALKNIQKSLECSYFDVTKNPMILAEAARKFPSVEIVIKSNDKPIMLDNAFPNFHTYLQKSNTFSNSNIPVTKNVISDKGNLFACGLDDDSPISKLTDPLAYSTIFWRGNVEERSVKRPVYLCKTGIVEAPDFIIKHLLNAHHNMDIDMFYIVYTLLEDCSSCDSALPHLKNLKDISRPYKTPLFFVACNKLKNVCDAQNITGFPNLIAYKTISQQHLTTCGLSYHHSYSIPYHGAFLFSHLIEWFNDVNDMGIHFGKPHEFHEGCNIHLTVSTSNNTLDNMPLECVKAICKHLMYAECFILEPTSSFVSSITLQRRDGVTSLIYSDGVAVEETFSYNPDLHYGHAAHEYSHISCAMNMPLCLNSIQKFIVNHSRMLVTELSPMLFHTSTSYKPLFGNLPVLIALVPDDALSTPFMINLQAIARKFYAKVAVSYVNVDMYPTWITGMLPVTEELPPQDSWIFRYPRVLIFHLHDHEHAAFLQISGEGLREQDIVEFVEDYLVSGTREPCYGI